MHVHGPQEAQRNENIVSDKAVIKVNVLRSSFSGIERKKRRVNGDRRTNEMERVIKDIYRYFFHNINTTFSPTYSLVYSGNILLDLYPRSEIVIIVHILEVDGSILSTIINAVSMALMDAGVMMKDIITACNVGVMRSNICVDLTNMEEIHCSSSLFIAIKSRSNVNNIVYMNLDKKINPEQLQACLDEATANCLLIRGQIEKGMKENMQELKSRLL